MPRRTLLPAIALLLQLGCAAPLPLVDAGLWQDEASWLADPAREGRGLGSAGLAASAQHLALRFDAAGLAPGAPDGTFFQSFRMPVAIRVEAAQLSFGAKTLARDRDYCVLLSSESGRFAGPLVFAGYGLQDSESGRDDWAGLDARNAIVLVLEGGSGLPSRRGATLLAAREHGARALLFAPVPGEHANAAEPTLEDPPGANPTRLDSGVVALALSRAAAEKLAARAGLDLGALARAAEHRFRPSLHGASVSGEVRIARDEGMVANVVGRLPGNEPALAHEQIVIGAHYDHVGRGEFGSQRPGSAPAIHPGADDNASGAAGLVALARALSVAPRPARTLVFIAFTAEEAGLIGSAHYVAGASDVAAMINLDMIGRLGAKGVTVFGAESGAGLADLVRASAEKRSLPVAFVRDDSQGPSDQASFHAARIPALLFHTGMHEAYHTPDDRAEALVPGGAARVLALVADVALALANAEVRPAFAATPPP